MSVNLERYLSEGKRGTDGNLLISIMHGIPIEHLQAVRDAFDAIGLAVTMRWRGPRSTDGRGRHAQQSTCMREHATHFAVYPRNRNRFSGNASGYSTF